MKHIPKSPQPARCRCLTTLALTAALGLAACSALPTPAPAPTLYDFGRAGATAPATQIPAQTAMRAPLQLAKVSASGLPVNSQPVLYRYAFEDEHQLRAYQQARWSQPVEQLLAQQLQQQLSGRGPVLDDEYTAARLQQGDASSLLLRVDVERMEQRFSTPHSSEAVVRLRATLIQPGLHGDLLLGQQSFEQRSPAASADAAGGTQAMAQAAQAAVAALDAWIDTLLLR